MSASNLFLPNENLIFVYTYQLFLQIKTGSKTNMQIKFLYNYDITHWRYNILKFSLLQTDYN